MGMWAVTAQIERTVEINGESWASSRQVPTFALNDQIQGITDPDHAARIAADVIDHDGSIRAAGGILHITAVPADTAWVSGPERSPEPEAGQ